MQSDQQKTLLSVAIVGCGTVGGGTARLILDNAAHFEGMAGVGLRLAALVDKDFTHARKLGLPEGLFRTDLDAVLADPGVDAVVELVGGTGFAKAVFEKALAAGKHVVTANKALLAHYGPELFALARRNGKAIGFEASCGGGIPVIRALYDGLMANRASALYGIVNGTCNYILTQMNTQGQSYAEALKGAQALGFAEADPTLDVGGGDSAHKIAILAGLAFGAAVPLDAVRTKGIDTLNAADVASGAKLGYTIKLIAQARRAPEGVAVRVEPCFVSGKHPLAWVSGSFNALSVYGNAVGHTLYYGRGAGASPTASAVVADLLSIATGAYPLQFARLNAWADRQQPAAALPDSAVVRRYFVRLNVTDKPGVLARITAVLGERAISVASIHQAESAQASPAPGAASVIIITHPTDEATMRAALAAIAGLPDIAPESACIPILDEPEEFAG